MKYPEKILHWINDQDVFYGPEDFFPKFNPATGQVISQVIKGNQQDVEQAVSAAEKSYEVWSNVSVIQRSKILRQAAQSLEANKEEIAALVALESGKSKKDSLGEVETAVEGGLFMAGEGRRYYGQILSSQMPNRSVQLIRQSIGPGALIVPFNNPLASICAKVFPALLCGNAIVLKSHEYTPYTAIWLAKIFKTAGLPAGIFSVLQGSGEAVGAPLASDRRIQFISLTGSLATGQSIITASASRLAKVSIEAGGKNPLVVCADADLELAVTTAVKSAFVDAGQRCAAASRLIVVDAIYEQFKESFISQVNKLKVGVSDDDDFGAIISEKRLNEISEKVEAAVLRGAMILSGGRRLDRKGYFLPPTVLENVSADDEISQNELFGPVVILYRAKDFNHALALASNSKFKLTGAIHTKNIDYAQEFIKRYQAGVVRVNGPTYGSEPHMPFGGLGLSGNGWREPGLQSLDFYSEWKQVSIDHSPDNN